MKVDFLTSLGITAFEAAFVIVAILSAIIASYLAVRSSQSRWKSYADQLEKDEWESYENSHPPSAHERTMERTMEKTIEKKPDSLN